MGGRIKAAEHFWDPLALLQHPDHMRMEHSALQHTRQTLHRHPSLFHPGVLDDIRSPRTGGPALPRNTRMDYGWSYVEEGAQAPPTFGQARTVYSNVQLDSWTSSAEGRKCRMPTLRDTVINCD